MGVGWFLPAGLLESAPCYRWSRRYLLRSTFRHHLVGTFPGSGSTQAGVFRHPLADPFSSPTSSHHITRMGAYLQPQRFLRRCSKAQVTWPSSFKGPRPFRLRPAGRPRQLPRRPIAYGAFPVGFLAFSRPLSPSGMGTIHHLTLAKASPLYGTLRTSALIDGFHPLLSRDHLPRTRGAAPVSLNNPCLKELTMAPRVRNPAAAHPSLYHLHYAAKDPGIHYARSDPRSR